MLDEGPSIIIAQWVLFGAASCAVGIRVGACRRPQYGFWWDDLVVFIALALFLATCVIGTLACTWGVGKYAEYVDMSDLPKATLMGIIATDLGMIADSVSKLAVALLVIRLFHPRIWVKWTMISCTLLNVFFNVLLVIFSFVQCSPAKYQWNRTTVSGHCWSINVYMGMAYFTGACAALLDISFSLYPLVVISQLHMRWRKKLAVMATMSFGLGTFAITTYKVATQYPHFREGATEPTRILANIMFWNAIGVAFTIIAGSIPTWGWLFRTNTWKHIFYTISGGRMSDNSSCRNSTRTIEKTALGWRSVQPSRETSNYTTPQVSCPPSREEVPSVGPIMFPERAPGYSWGTNLTATSARTTIPPPDTEEVIIVMDAATVANTHANTRSLPRVPSRSRQPLELDSIQQLERATWG